MNPIEFIEENKEMFIHWLFKKYPDTFPRECENASDIFGCWLYLHYPEHNIQIQSGLYDGWSHSWIEVDGQIVDFTINQFLGGMKEERRTDLTDIEFYNLYFKKYIDSPFITGDLVKNYKLEEGLFIIQYDLAKIHQRKGSDFQTYLAEVR